MSAQTTSVDLASPVAATDPAWAGNPMCVGLVGFTIGSLALGMQMTGYVSTAGAGSTVPVILASSAVATFVAMVWAIKLGQNIVAGVWAVFSGFWLSYVALLLGLFHNWFAIGARDIMHTEAMFLICWLVVIAVLTLGTLRLASSLTAALLLVDVALVLDLIGTIDSSTGAVKGAGVCAFLFAAIGAYLLLGNLNQAAGGNALPAGQPVIRG